MARTSKTRRTVPSPAEVREAARALCARFGEAGFALAEPAILQPAELFLGLSGEDIRRRLYMVADPSGAEMCLRPDFTIPVARAYLDEAAPAEARYCYAGPAFRARRDAAAGENRGEFYQAGIEIFGARDGEAAEREVMRHALVSVTGAGVRRLDIRLGDPGLFAGLLACLDLPEAWTRRLRRHFWRHDLAEDLAAALSARETANGVGREALARALAGLDRRAAAELVEEVLALAGIVPVGGRSVEEIAQRFMERAGGAPAALSERAVRVVRAFLDIEGAPRAALAGIRRLVRKEGLDLAAHVDGLARRIDAVEALVGELGVAASLVFEAEFGRRLEYYTGLVFELRDPARPGLAQIAGGGRYDQLLTDLGARRRVPAVGCAVYVDRLIAPGGRR